MLTGLLNVLSAIAGIAMVVHGAERVLCVQWLALWCFWIIQYLCICFINGLYEFRRYLFRNMRSPQDSIVPVGKPEPSPIEKKVTKKCVTRKELELKVASTHTLCRRGSQRIRRSNAASMRGPVSQQEISKARTKYRKTWNFSACDRYESISRTSPALYQNFYGVDTRTAT